MSIMQKQRSRDPSRGYATDFVPLMERILPTVVERGIRITANAGGVNPRACADAVVAVTRKLGLAGRVRVGIVSGDDLLDRLDELMDGGHALANMETGAPLSTVRDRVLSANAYLGAASIVEALRRGADIVITGRVTDAALALGPAAWRFGWGRDDWDRLAAAIVEGHIIECGAQCCGGNYSFFQEVPTYDRIGFPIAEMAGDGSFVITKHPGTGGQVSVGTVTAQLLYEIDSPRYLNPDVTARFDTIQLAQEGPDRVRVTGVRGEPPPATTKLCLNYFGGYRNSLTFVLTGLDVPEKAKLIEDTFWKLVGGRERFAETTVSLLRYDREDPETNEAAVAHLKITVKDPDAAKVGRAFSNKAIEMGLAHYPGFHMTAPPSEETGYAVYWPTVIPAPLIEQEMHLDGETVRIPPVLPPADAPELRLPVPALPPPPTGPTRRVPLGRVAGARSGDKGGNANVGMCARDPRAYAWLLETLTAERIRALMPEARGLAVERHPLPNLLAINFVIKGLLGEGVSGSTRSDPQAKGLGEYLRAKLVEVPETLLG